MNTTLTSLNFAGNILHATGGQHLADIINSNALVTLNCSNCKLGTNRVRPILETLKNNKVLTSLNLRNNSLDNSASLFADMIQNNDALKTLIVKILVDKG